ncbi:MAG TPA: 2-dehydropantoate 2-reductase, partial [Spirochaetia bacterium]|nr:2-dehydropantoate 2-reductase [Spirochaetia bacterium]
MRKIHHAAIAGAGAVGAAVASMIHDTDPDMVTIIAEGDRAERYRSSGLLVNGKQYHFSVQEASKVDPAPDLVIVATKSYDLPAAIELLSPAIGRQTVVLSLLNGITSEKLIAERFGAERVLPAMIIGIDAVRVGGRIDYASRGNINFGPNAAVSPIDPVRVSDHPQWTTVEAVRAFFAHCAIPCTVKADMERTLWWKFMVNVGINQASAILRAPYGVFQQNRDARALMISAMEEVVALSAAAGIGLVRADIDQWDNTLTTLLPGGKTSMLQDVEAGRKTEVDLFAGAMIEMGDRYGVPVPVNRAMYRMLKTIES